MRKEWDGHVPGNVVASAALVERTLSRDGLALHKGDEALRGMFDEGMQVKAIRFRSSGHPEGEWLAVVTMETENGGVVGFHSGVTLVDCITGVLRKLTNRSLKWKEDDYAK